MTTDSKPYDMSIHTNPSAEAWVKFFRQNNPNCNVADDIMLGWFSNCMMAMHDHLKGGALNGDHAQYLLDNSLPTPRPSAAGDANETLKKLCKLSEPINALIGAARSAKTLHKYYGVPKEWEENLLEHAEKAAQASDKIFDLVEALQPPQPVGDVVQEDHIIKGVGVCRKFLREQFPSDEIYNKVVFIVSLLQRNAEAAIAAMQPAQPDVDELVQWIEAAHKRSAYGYVRTCDVVALIRKWAKGGK